MISPYYPQASQVERFNRNLKAALTIFHHSQHTRWDENLLALAVAFNTAWHESTGATPALLLLGRELNHPLGMRWELSEVDLQQSPHDTKDFWGQALANLKRAQDRVARCYNALRSEAVFRPGDLVLEKRHPQSSNILQQSAKIAIKRSGLCVIAEFLTPVTVHSDQL
ncbi:uncharacterized protein LOC111868341 [Cryptotermes secundus]|uniref:uncharacterized protein LOC111868341 n=1 Tax=Cryptotermes secundus TaxID=105785 RepID=UPI000CD7C0D6|nr:uncharacterized protein LOC111868341 [Cryptotermes secundus]